MKSSRQLQQYRGFTIVELMVAIAIIVMLLGIISAAIGQARENAREKDRVSDLANIEFALTLYREKNRSYPAYPNGVEIGVGADTNNPSIDDIIAQYNGNTYTDPSSSGVGGSYGYWYDSDFTCTQAGQAVLFVRTMEQPEKNANFTEVCTQGVANVADADSYVVVLKQ